jgi:putative Mg2+ transporter-C (MgtC) family protein
MGQALVPPKREKKMLPDWELVLRLLLAALLGSFIGADRERLVWAAGLRTHMLVCVGSCLFMIVSAFGFGGVLGTHVILDPSRIAAQVVSGIGFLGAGSILLRGEVVRGLTTAASLWTVAAIGLAVGGGLYVEAIAATLIILVILAGIKPLEEKFLKNRQVFEIRIRVARGQLPVEELDKILGYRSRRITRFIRVPTEDADLDEITLTLARISPGDVAEIEKQLKATPSVHDVERPSI